MAADGTLIVPKVPLVMSGARGRRVADLGYSNGRVSRNVTIARDALKTRRMEIRISGLSG